MEKNIAYPTDARLYERARDQLADLAQEAGVELRQSYARLAPRLALQVGRYAHAKQFRVRAVSVPLNWRISERGACCQKVSQRSGRLAWRMVGTGLWVGARWLNLDEATDGGLWT